MEGLRRGNKGELVELGSEGSSSVGRRARRALNKRGREREEERGICRHCHRGGQREGLLEVGQMVSCGLAERGLSRDR